MPIDIPESEIVHFMEGEIKNEGMVLLKADCARKNSGQFVYAVLDGMVIRKGCYTTIQHEGESRIAIVWLEENITGEKAPEIERVPIYPDPVII